MTEVKLKPVRNFLYILRIPDIIKSTLYFPVATLEEIKTSFFFFSSLKIDKAIEYWSGFLKKGHVGEKFSSLWPLEGPPRKDGLCERTPVSCEPRPGIGAVRSTKRGSAT